MQSNAINSSKKCLYDIFHIWHIKLWYQSIWLSINSVFIQKIWTPHPPIPPWLSDPIIVFSRTISGLSACNFGRTKTSTKPTSWLKRLLGPRHMLASFVPQVFCPWPDTLQNRSHGYRSQAAKGMTMECQLAHPPNTLGINLLFGMGLSMGIKFHLGYIATRFLF